MKNKYLKYWFIGILFIVLSSCSNDSNEILFPESPAERMAQSNNELSNLLLSQSGGYKGVYFTKNDEFGGFTFFMKFNANGTVQTTSDFDSDTNMMTSSYEVRFGTTTELVFTTRGHIQKVSNPESAGLIGTGYKGTSVFQYFGNENGTIILRDVRNTTTGYFVLTPTGFSSFETQSLASVTKSLNNRNEFVNSDSVTAFPFLSVKNGTNLNKYALNYDNVRLFANPTTINENGSVSDIKFGIAFTENGLILSPALVLDGVTFENFIFDSTNGFEYVATVGNATARIGYGKTPVTPLDPYAFGVRANIAVFNDYEPEKSSTAFNNFYQSYTNQLVTNYNLTIDVVYFININNGGQPILVFGTNFGNFLFGVNFVVNNGIVKFTDAGLSNTSAGNKAIFQPLINAFIGGSSGFYLNNTGNLQIYSNRTFSMINVADPTMVINYYDE